MGGPIRIGDCYISRIGQDAILKTTSACRFDYTRCWALFLMVAVVGTCLSPMSVQAFDVQDLPMQQRRQVFYQHGLYAIGVNDVILDPAHTRQSEKSVELALFYISEKQWDRICYINFKQPVKVTQSETRTLLESGTSSLEVSAQGINYRNAEQYGDDMVGKSNRICHIYLDSIRHDDALAYSVGKSGKIEQQLVRPFEIKRSKEPFDQKLVTAQLKGDDDFKPSFAFRTEEGLWVRWEASLKTQKMERLMDSTVSLRGTGGNGTPSFYNTGKVTAAGASIDFSMQMRVEQMEGFPLPLQVSEKLTLHDSHIHITSNSEIRDSVLMARKYGYRMEVLSILYNEQPHGRLFLGDEHVFAVAKRYPDVYIPFALIQFNTHGFAGVQRKGPDTPEHMIQQWKDGALGYKGLVKWSKREVEIDDPQYDPLYDVAEERRMPIVHHTEGEGDGSSPTRTAGVAAKHPNMPVIMAHMKGQDIDVIVELLRKYPNLYLQHSHTYQKGPDGMIARERLVKEGLAHKIVFGTDLQTDHSPMFNDRRNLQMQLEELGVDEKTIDGIMFGTLENMLKNVKRPDAAAD